MNQRIAVYIKRDLSERIQSGAAQVPVIAIVGPRQSGKSTLAKELFSKHAYVDLQDADLAEFAHQDPKGFLANYSNEHGIIIDEAQYAPTLFPQIKVEADKNPRPGFFILSGSQNFQLHDKISESLAGRVYIYTLLPLSIKELKDANYAYARAKDQIFKGFYPRVYQPHIDSQDYYQNYISTYVERDIRTIKNIDNILIFKKFMQLCALRVGTTLNVANLATSCSISQPTAHSWLGLLETSYILFLLPSYHDNLGKRATKSPKLYFYDVGLATTLMGIDKEVIAQKRDIYGALFENMMIVDLMKNFNSTAKKPTLTFYRDTNQNEIDLIIEMNGEALPIEIKASESMNSKFFDTAIWFQEQTKNSRIPIVIYGGNKVQKRTMGDIIPWNDVEKIIEIK